MRHVLIAALTAVLLAPALDAQSDSAAGRSSSPSFPSADAAAKRAELNARAKSLAAERAAARVKFGALMKERASQLQAARAQLHDRLPAAGKAASPASRAEKDARHVPPAKHGAQERHAHAAKHERAPSDRGDGQARPGGAGPLKLTDAKMRKSGERSDAARAPQHGGKRSKSEVDRAPRR